MLLIEIETSCISTKIVFNSLIKFVVKSKDNNSPVVYHERIQEILATDKLMDDYKKERNNSAIQDLTRSRKKQLRLLSYAQAIEKQIRHLRKQEKLFADSNSLL